MILYKKRRKYKYNLHSDLEFETDIQVDEDKCLRFLSITKDGKLTITKGYSWDGPSGPAIDTKNFMQGSLIHDALYQLIREGKLGRNLRKRSDEILREICIADGMCRLRAWWVYLSVRVFGGCAAKPNLITAP